MIFIVGANGLVGSSFVRFCKKKKYKFRKILRHNNSKYFGKKCDILFDDRKYPAMNLLYINLYNGLYYNDNIYSNKKMII